MMLNSEKKFTTVAHFVEWTFFFNFIFFNQTWTSFYTVFKLADLSEIQRLNIFLLQATTTSILTINFTNSWLSRSILLSSFLV